MKNPCEECIIKVNCTAVCPDKNNYGILLKHALRNYRNAMTKNRNQKFWTDYNNYLDLWNDHKNDETTIYMRTVRIPNGY